MHSRSHVAGVTLVELLFVLAIAAVLSVLAGPSLSAMLDGVRLASTSSNFFWSLQLARNEAVKRGSRVVICKSSGGAVCSSSGSWEQGWIVFHDDNNNAQVDPGEVVVQVEQAQPSSLRLAGNGHVTSYVSFTLTGHARLVSGAYQLGTLTLCRRSVGPVEARQFVLASSGRVRTQKANLPNCA